jgi:hypothetical protein
VNAATPGASITVYPGHYGSRATGCGLSGTCDCNSAFAPALIVYKDGLTISAVDPNPSATVVESDHPCWSNIQAVVESTAGGLTPTAGTAPAAVLVLANDVTVQGLTFRRPMMEGGSYAAAVVGGLYGGYGLRPGQPLGFGRNTLQGCTIDGGGGPVLDGILIWHSARNRLENNSVLQPARAGVLIYDGWYDPSITLASPSRHNRIVGNRITGGPTDPAAGECLKVGASHELPTDIAWADNAGTHVQGNDCGGSGIAISYSSGTKVFVNNTNVGWTLVESASGVHFNGK